MQPAVFLSRSSGRFPFCRKKSSSQPQKVPEPGTVVLSSIFFPLKLLSYKESIRPKKRLSAPGTNTGTRTGV
jgi:hypothetical protein